MGYQILSVVDDPVVDDPVVSGSPGGGGVEGAGDESAGDPRERGDAGDHVLVGGELAFAVRDAVDRRDEHHDRGGDAVDGDRVMPGHRLEPHAAHPGVGGGFLGELHSLERVVLDVADVEVLDVDTDVPLCGEVGDLPVQGVPGGQDVRGRRGPQVDDEVDLAGHDDRRVRGGR
jgi:hypothetical protein